MKFTKMHGIGNDYVYVNCFEEKVPDPERTAKFVSDRHFGIGSDGLILIKPHPEADCEMEMYNLDGSKGKMCGNGIRCVAKYAYEHGIAPRQTLTIATGSGLRTVSLQVKDGSVTSVSVDMGNPILEAALIPLNTSFFTGKVINQPLEVAGVTYQITAVSMGNPHCITYIDSVDALDLPKIGPLFENHPAFPEKVNTEFVEVLDNHTLLMRVWERGSGETMACGTGACACLVSSVLNGKVDPSTPAVVKLLGGDLSIYWDQRTGIVTMTGPATEVFSGEIMLPWE